MTKRCRSCDCILTWENILNEKLGGAHIDVCIPCLAAAVSEIIAEEKQAVYRRIEAVEAEAEKS